MITIFMAISFIMGIFAGVSATKDTYKSKAAKEMSNEANNIKKGN